jgi:hypothetical protein
LAGIGSLDWDEVCNLGEMVDDYPIRFIPTIGSQKYGDEIHHDSLPFPKWNL